MSEWLKSVMDVLRTFNLPVNILEVSTESSLIVDRRWYDNQHCGAGRSVWYWTTDGVSNPRSSEITEETHGLFGGGGYDVDEISNVSYAIRVATTRALGGAEIDRVTRVVVWPGCDPADLINAIAPVVYGRYADKWFVSALESAEEAKKWVAERFGDPSEKPSGVNARQAVYRRRTGFGIDGFSWYKAADGETHVASLPGGSYGPLARLAAAHGVAALLPPR